MKSSTLKKIVEYISLPIISIIILLLFTIFLKDVEPFVKDIIFFLFYLILFLILVFVFSEDLVHGRWKRYLRKKFRRNPIVAIIRENGCPKIKSRFEPESWQNFLGEDFKYEYITTLNPNKISDKFVVILNPYGECYPEINILEKTSFKRIKDYVKSGGIFVSISGVPFWFAWNRLSIGAPSTAKEVYSYAGDLEGMGVHSSWLGTRFYGKMKLENVYSPSPLQSLTDTLTYEELGVLTTTGGVVLRQVHQLNRRNVNDINFFGDLANIGDIDYIFEFRAIRKPVQSCIPILRSNMQVHDNDLEIYPLACVPYGNGYFIFTGMHMDIRNDTKIIVIDENENGIECYLPHTDCDLIIEAQAQKLCQALKNLIENEDQIRRFLLERR